MIASAYRIAHAQSQSSGGTSRTFFAASARSIAFSAAATALDLIAASPMITTPATDAVHFQTPRSRPWRTVYSMSRYFIMSRAFAENASPSARVPPAEVIKMSQERPRKIPIK
jgi:hypothetical protein